MKYCPYCGAGVIDGTVSFCAECGKALPAQKQNNKEIDKAESLFKTEVNQTVFEVECNADDGYDGYYDDLLPIDDGKVHIGADKELVKKIAILGVSVFAVITLCVLMMCLL